MVTNSQLAYMWTSKAESGAAFNRLYTALEKPLFTSPEGCYLG